MFDFINGKPIVERLLPLSLAHAATSFVESLKINSITENSRHSRRVVVKRRNVYGQRAADLINFYFRAAGVPIRYLSDVREWRRWEARCFQMLNGDRFRATVTDSRTVTLDKLPGNNLWEHMNQGTLSPATARTLCGKNSEVFQTMGAPQSWPTRIACLSPRLSTSPAMSAHISLIA